MDGVLKSLDQQLFATEQLMLPNNSDTDQLAANYDEKLKQMEKAQGKDFEMGQNSESLIE
jgi:hypothetical protein